ncbi:ribonuclease H-like protein [Macrolepiota fuliginosa MF-IS2]|uniref:ribonuclease H n=1 Tax=Macrolepiota fuliginosa MF-IS2 TaxID=1400762 RepID=A0A9P6C6F6_9AGAR|nr:ribonuclease H-like protein [Macrolepiota fuliginosa MF-IS2]
MSRIYTPPNGNSTPDDVVYAHPHSDFTNMQQTHMGNDGRFHNIWSCDIAILADGACAGNGTNYARAGMGVYFAPDSRYNISEKLEAWDGQQTNQHAEIRAAVLALEKVIELVEDGCLQTENVVLISDSSYVVDAMTNWVYRWRNNGWMNNRGFEVTNRDDFERLDRLINILDDDFDVSVRLWLVPRCYVQEADRLAKDAINS